MRRGWVGWTKALEPKGDFIALGCDVGVDPPVFLLAHLREVHQSWMLSQLMVPPEMFGFSNPAEARRMEMEELCEKFKALHLTRGKGRL